MGEGQSQVSQERLRQKVPWRLLSRSASNRVEINDRLFARVVRSQIPNPIKFVDDDTKHGSVDRNENQLYSLHPSISTLAFERGNCLFLVVRETRVADEQGSWRDTIRCSLLLFWPKADTKPMVRVSGDLPQRDRSTSRALDDDAMSGNILNPNSCICLARPSPSAKKRTSEYAIFFWQKEISGDRMRHGIWCC